MFKTVFWRRLVYLNKTNVCICNTIKKAPFQPETANLALQDIVWFSLSWSHLKPVGPYQPSLIGIKIGLYFTHPNGPILALKGIFKKLKQQIRGRLRKHHLKTEFPLLQTLSRLVPSRSIRQMLANCLGVQWILRDWTVQEKKNKRQSNPLSCVLVLYKTWN